VWLYFRVVGLGCCVVRLYCRVVRLYCCVVWLCRRVVGGCCRVVWLYCRIGWLHRRDVNVWFVAAVSIGWWMVGRGRCVHRCCVGFGGGLVFRCWWVGAVFRGVGLLLYYGRRSGIRRVCVGWHSWQRGRGRGPRVVLA
jgi:hypothetical protein